MVWTGAGSTTTASSQLRIILDTQNYTLKLNGHDRFAAQDVRYFTRNQVHQHHTGQWWCQTAGTWWSTSGARIAVYSFALKPEEHQPSGTCNFSRIDNAQLNYIR